MKASSKPKNMSFFSNGRPYLACAVALVALLSSKNARADYYYQVVTTGTVTSGNTVGTPFGLGPSLTGDSYTLSVLFDGPGAAYFSVPGSFASDSFNTNLPASVTLTINNTVIFTGLTINSAASLIEDSNDLFTTLSGVDSNSNTVNIAQNLTTGSSFTTTPDLQSSVPTYTLGSNDTGFDTYSWANSNNTQQINILTTNDATFTVAVPEPASLGLFGLGVLGAGILRRRRKA